MFNFEEFQCHVAKVPNLFTTRHAHILYGLVRWLQPSIIVEIGAFKGYSTAWLAKAAQENHNGGMVYAIDDFSLYTSPIELQNNLVALGVGANVMLRDGDSRNTDLWPHFVDLVYLDGNHSYDYVNREVQIAVEKGADCIILHDSQSWEGVQRFVKENDIFGYSKIGVGFDHGLTIYMREPGYAKPLHTEADYPEGYVK
jgi:hypothetical protein